MVSSPNWMTEAQVARYLGLSRSRVSALCRDQVLLTQTYSGTKMVWMDQVEDYKRTMLDRKQKRIDQLQK